MTNTTARFPDDHILTADDAAWLMDRGACEKALEYIGRTVSDTTTERPAFALMYAADRLSDVLFAKAVVEEPGIALVYAAARMNHEQIDAAARIDPWGALEYAAHRLSDEQIDAAARARPWLAQYYAPARYAELIGS